LHLPVKEFGVEVPGRGFVLTADFEVHDGGMAWLLLLAKNFGQALGPPLLEGVESAPGFFWLGGFGHLMPRKKKDLTQKAQKKQR
jgi:hypothetical protein